MLKDDWQLHLSGIELDLHFDLFGFDFVVITSFLCKIDLSRRSSHGNK